MDKELKKKWVDALRSGKYEQGRGYLCNEGLYCCVGVLAEIKGIPKHKAEASDSLYLYQGQKNMLPAITLYELGLTDDKVHVLVDMNDGGHNHNGKSFIEIANYIERYL